MTTQRPVQAVQRLAILGSTGSVGSSTLDVVARHPERFEVVGLTAYQRTDVLIDQCRVFKPRRVVLPDAARAATVRAAMVAYANGEIEGEAGFVVGASVSPFELAGAVNNVAPGIYVQKMEISIVGNPFGVVEVPINIKQLATLNANNITVVIL